MKSEDSFITNIKYRSRFYMTIKINSQLSLEEMYSKFNSVRCWHIKPEEYMSLKIQKRWQTQQQNFYAISRAQYSDKVEYLLSFREYVTIQSIYPYCWHIKYAQKIWEYIFHLQSIVHKQSKVYKAYKLRIYIFFRERYRQLRARRALTLFKDVPLRTRKVLLT